VIVGSLESIIRQKRGGQLVNLVGNPLFTTIHTKLSSQLQQRLVETKDPRALGLQAPWDYYPYYGLRRNPNWKVDQKP
jgi:hypothetical protein